MKYDRVKKAHDFCINNKPALLKDEKCGCFFCIRVFETNLITEWIPDTDGTALCPFCGVDAVIPEGSGYPINKEFLEVMHKYWFDK